MKPLLVFMGKPGSGKTTLIKELFPKKKIIDVKPFVLAYEVDGQVPEKKTVLGYRDMYKEISEKHADMAILELGTNHPALNIEELQKQAEVREVHIFLCTASVDTLRERIIGRDENDNMEAMEKRLKRNFPDTHLPLIELRELSYSILDMEQPMTDNMILVKQLLRSK